MRFLALCLFLPLTVFAQEYSTAPLLVVQPQPNVDTVAVAPKPPAAPTPAPAPTAVTPAAPEAPENPLTKIWPRDTVPIFITSCTKFRMEALKPCTCIITHVIKQFGHDEFMAVAAQKDGVENDPRLLLIRQQCTADLQNQKNRTPEGN